jgi:hypothetical protein
MQAAPARRGAPHPARLDTALFVLMLAVYAAPLIFLRHFPSQDGPAHVNNASVLRFYNDAQHSVLRQYYTIDYAPVPNWTGHILLVGAMHVVSPRIAEKLLVALIALGLPLALRYALLALAPEQAFLALLVFPFVYSFPLHMGFYNFCIGVMLTFVAVGYTQHRSGKETQSGKHSVERSAGSNLTTRDVLVLALLIVCIYFSHILAWCMTVAVLFGVETWRALAQWRTERPKEVWSWLVQQARPRLLPLLAATLPSLLLVIYYLASPASADAHDWPLPDFGDRFADLIHFRTINVFHPADNIFATSLAALFLIMATSTVAMRLRRRSLWHASDVWGLLLIALHGVFLTVPEGMAGGYYLSPRMELYACLFALLWFATQPVPAVARAALRVLAVGLALGMLALRWPTYRQLDEQITQYESAGNAIAQNATLLPIAFSQRAYTPLGNILADNVSFFLHTAGYIAARRGLVTFDNYEANTPYFPVHFRDSVNPYHAIGTEVDGDFPPHARFADYTERTGGKVDYVLIWRMFKAQRSKPDADFIFNQLKERYSLVFTSRPWGFAMLYRRKD